MQKDILCCFRKTSSRDAILSCIKDSHKPLSIEDIKKTFRKKHVHIDEATIYRTMKTFVGNGELQQIDFHEGKFRYESASLPHHHHLVCEKCGAVEDVPVQEKLLLKQLRIKTKFKVLRHSLEFFGLCNKCQ
ncbi:MAG: transcriptional repressor [Microgenomates group bacterium]